MYFFKTYKSKKGQGLVEYLILVAVIAIATLGIVRVLGNNIQAKFATIVYSLQGGKQRSVSGQAVRQNHIKSKDLSNFFQGATLSEKNN